MNAYDMENFINDLYDAIKIKERIEIAREKDPNVHNMSYLRQLFSGAVANCLDSFLSLNGD